MIVFCDGCNTPYHQLCHDPPIDDLVVAIESAEWFCHLCDKMRQQRPLTMGMSGQELTQEEKQTYLANLPISSLVEIIFAAEKLHPELPIYDPDTRNIAATLERQAAMAKARGLTASTGASTPDPSSDAPKWEEMIVRAITAIDPIGGVQPKFIFEWIGANFPALEGRDVRAEAQSSLQAALRKGVLMREGHAYRVNPEWEQKELMKVAEQQQQRIPQAWGIAPIGKGVKLLAETEEGGDRWLVDDGETGAISHQFKEVDIPPNGIGLGIVQAVSVP